MDFNLLSVPQTSTGYFPPLLAPIMSKRQDAWILSGAVALQVGLAAAGLPGWPCPFKTLLGIPCPGCGLSTATGFLLHGKWDEAIMTHAFAPVFFAGLLVVVGISILPVPLRVTAIQKIAALERRTGLTVVIFIALILYWGFRLLYR